jgi:hypothetical protein
MLLDMKMRNFLNAAQTLEAMANWLVEALANTQGGEARIMVVLRLSFGPI